MCNWSCLLRCMVTYNEPRSSLAGKISPNPLHEDTYSQAGLRQEFEVHRRPSQPREESADVNFSALQNGEALSNNGHIALVEVPKRLRGPLQSAYTAANQFSGIASLLHSNLGYSRQWLTILIERRCIANDKNFRIVGHR